MADVPPDLDNASHEDLKELVQTLLERANALERENAALHDEDARLKGKPPQLNVKPSGMAEKGQSRGGSKPKAKSKKPGRGSKRSRLTIDEDRHLQPAGLPNGSRFKGYQDHVVQELVIQPRTVRYRRERWLTPDGRTVRAELPGHVRYALSRRPVAGRRDRAGSAPWVHQETPRALDKGTGGFIDVCIRLHGNGGATAVAS